VQYMWAPWRMKYITQSEADPGCIFCMKPEQQQDEDNGILLRARSVYVILNAYPYNPGHLMVVPYDHISTITDLPVAVVADLMTVARRSVAILGEAMAPQGVNIGVNQGQAAGAGIADHIHLHVVPRWLGDTNFMTSVGETKVLPELVKDTYARLAPLFSRPGD
jgi:ATP adenylyltransferase